MSEYPWDIENMMLAQHEQPCDCAICDDIHMARLMRRKRREAVERDCPYKKALEQQMELVNSNIITTWPDIAGRLIAIAKGALEI